MENIGHGTIIVHVTAHRRTQPVPGARVVVTDLANEESIELTTDESGLTALIRVETPPVEESLTPDSLVTPCALFRISVEKDGYTPVVVEDAQVFPGVESIQPVSLFPKEKRESDGRASSAPAVYRIPPHGLDAALPRSQKGPASGGRVLRSVYIPEFVRVHLGVPSAAARNISVPFIDYVKNVACSEIYPTWPEAAIRANVHAQVGFVLNRIFTEWYPSQGYPFDITNSTAFDQYFVEGRTIFQNVSDIVDRIFNVYPRREGNLEPLFSAYCNGTTSTCRGLSQWGTVTLANRGYNPLQIIQYYYGRNVELVQANDIQGLEESYPGYPLRRGSRGNDVRMIQYQLDRIRQNYTAIPVIDPIDGIFGSETEAAVRAFQRIFRLTVDGVVGRATWYSISYLYATVKRLAELDSEGEPDRIGDAAIIPYPGVLLRWGSRGEAVRVLQHYLRDLATVYDILPQIAVDGVYGAQTYEAVETFQMMFGLDSDGIVGPATWNALTDVYRNTFPPEETD